MPVNIRPLDRQLIRDTFHYADGHIYWIKSGRKVTHVTDHGYIRVQLRNRKYFVHRIVWVLHYGDFETGYEIDHINGNKQDNRIENLRLVTHSGNMFNRKNKSNTGMRYVHKSRNRYQVKYCLNHKWFYFGTFKDLDEAKKVAAKVIEDLSKTHEAPNVQGAFVL